MWFSAESSLFASGWRLVSASMGKLFCSNLQTRFASLAALSVDLVAGDALTLADVLNWADLLGLHLEVEVHLLDSLLLLSLLPSRLAHFLLLLLLPNEMLLMLALVLGSFLPSGTFRLWVLPSNFNLVEAAKGFLILKRIDRYCVANGYTSPRQPFISLRDNI